MKIQWIPSRKDYINSLTVRLGLQEALYLGLTIASTLSSRTYVLVSCGECQYNENIGKNGLLTVVNEYNRLDSHVVSASTIHNSKERLDKFTD